MILPMLAVLTTAILVAIPQDAWASDRPCRPWVSGSLYYDVTDSNGNPRSNPDDTLYPGDMVRYSFGYGFSGTCYSQRVHPVESGGAISAVGTSPTGRAEALIGPTNDCHGGGSRGAAGYGGDNSWRRDSPRTDCGFISLTVTAKERHCYQTSQGTRCVYIPRSASDTLRPPTVAPVVEVNLYEHVLADPYGYEAANRDMTNYVWDPVAVEHAADFIFKTEREGTITFDYVRTHSPLVEEGGYECDRRCSETLRVAGGPPLSATGIGFLPYPHRSENGGGMYAYTAPSLGNAGLQTIRYDVTVRNEGRMINAHHNSTEQLIALYDPVYAHYEYPVLRDGKKYAYDDRHATAMSYSGSVGSGPDDDDSIHPDRRSRINAFYSNTTMWSLFPGIAPENIDPALLQWDSTGHVNGTDTEPWISRGDGHAMFREAGYGIIYFAQEIAGIVLDESNFYNYRHNVTVHNNVSSDRWAGHDSYVSLNYTYQYPHTPFAAWYNVTSFGPGGEPDGTTPVSVTADVSNVTHSSVPEYVRDGSVTVLLDRYVHDKALFDTGDANFSRAVLDDTYDMSNTASGAGGVSMWLKKTGLTFDSGYLPGNAILNQSRYLALDLESEMATATRIPGVQIDRVLHTEFDVDYTERFTTGSIPLEVSRTSGPGADTRLATVSVPEWFGPIGSIDVDGEPVDINVDCIYECGIIHGGPGTVRVTNIWSGTATGPLEAAVPAEPGRPEETLEANMEYIWFVLVAGAGGYASYLALRRVWRRAGEETDDSPP